MKRLLLFLIVAAMPSFTYGLDFYILTNTEAKFYEQPSEKAKEIDVRFYTNEFLYVEAETNIDKIDWLKNSFLYKTRVTGWVKKSTAYSIGELEQGKKCLEILQKECPRLFDDKVTNKGRLMDMKFGFDSNSQHIWFQYIAPYEGGEWKFVTSLYKIEGTNLIRRIYEQSADNTIYFINKYIVLIGKRKDILVVFDTANLKLEKFQDYTDRKEPLYQVTYDFMLSRQSKGKEKFTYYKTGSHLEFDPTNRIMTTYFRPDVRRPFVIEKYRFEDGKFMKE